MRKLYATSALFALAVGAAWAQPPAQTDPPVVTKGEPLKKVEPPKKPADSTDAAIASALAHDADVKIARAKLQMAEAELAKAKLVVTQKVLVARNVIENARVELLVTEQQMEATVAMFRAERVADFQNRSEYRVVLAKVASAKSKLALAEAELKLLTGDGTAAAHEDERARLLIYRLQVQRAHEAAIAERGQTWLGLHERLAKSPAGPVPDRIRAALDKPVKLGANGTAHPVPQVLEALKRDAGLDVPVRGLESFALVRVISQGEELPAIAWLQVLQDQLGATAHVREYGILFAKKENAPADAVTLTEFWKQKPAVAAPVPAPKK